MSTILFRGRRYNVIPALNSISGKVYADASPEEIAKGKDRLQRIADGRRLDTSIHHKVSSDLWQVSAKGIRILYFIDHNDLIICHIYRKQTQKLPKAELKKAEEARRRYLDSKAEQLRPRNLTGRKKR